jgi:hypothetical protein
MRFVSIDIETTGLDPETCQILQIGAVIEDTVKVPELKNLPRFSCIVEHKLYTGQPFALNLNNWLIQMLASLETAKTKEDRIKIRTSNHIMGAGLVAPALRTWLIANGIPSAESGQVAITVAGKNFGTFDKLFLEKLPGWSAMLQINQRIIDPSIAFMNWQEDEKLPNLDTCLKRANLEGVVTHDAVQDAVDVIRVLRQVTNYYETNLNSGR